MSLLTVWMQLYRERRNKFLQGALGESHCIAGCKFLATAAVISKMVNSVADKWEVAEVHGLRIQILPN